MPHGMRLRKAVQQQEGRSRLAGFDVVPDIQRNAVRASALEAESGREKLGHGLRSRRASSVGSVRTAGPGIKCDRDCSFAAATRGAVAAEDPGLR